MKGTETLGKHRSLLLLGCEVLLLLSSAIWGEENFHAGRHVWFYFILLSGGGYLLAGSKKWLAWYCSILFLGILFSVLGEAKWFQVGRILSFTFSHLLMLWAVIRHSLFREGVPQTDRILAGVAGYLLLGFFWAVQCDWAVLIDGNAFINQLTGEPATSAEVLYFNFVTLTTLGFGDILPACPGARVITIFNSLSGVLYIAVLISSLVGKRRS